jgi:FkbH-like protein
MDRRGILLSIASANDEDLAISVLDKKGITHYFLHPQITWSNKVNSLQTIAKKLNIGLDSLGFVDDEPFEIEQVRQILPSVKTYPACTYKTLLDKPELDPSFKSEESRQRRKMYLQEATRAEAQRNFGKSRRDFLKACQTQMTIRTAEERDLSRILELMQRTHQLNATGEIFDEHKIRFFLKSVEHKMYVVELKDRYVHYGKVGVAICVSNAKTWRLISFLLSCRVLTRGVGTFFLAWLQYQAYTSGVYEFEGNFKKCERNHRMRMLYTLSGFRPLPQKRDGSIVFAKKCDGNLTKPDWFSLHEGDLR